MANLTLEQRGVLAFRKEEEEKLAAKLAYLEGLEERLDLQRNLPHLYGFNDYAFAKEFLASTNPQLFLVAANQIGKSSVQIRKMITWATEPTLWPKLWKTRPRQFWYLYPSRDFIDSEFDNKWEPEFLPRGKYKDHPQYGWKVEIASKHVHAIHFNTDVSIYFKSYMQNAQTLQGGTVHYIGCDEELLADLFPELQMRTAAVDGYFSMVFTATLGQEFWREAMEVRGEGERFPGAHKLHVSMYDCREFADGTPSNWTLEKIKRIESQCGTEAERLRRVEGRFVVTEGKIYPSFARERNYGDKKEDLKGWLLYAGVDVGSGGEQGHPAAIVFVAVHPSFQRGRVVKCWRGDKISTTASDVFKQFQIMRGSVRCTQQYYDWHSKDFYNIALRAGEAFTPAEKNHEFGENIVNTLFQNNMLYIEGSEESAKLANELSSITQNIRKVAAKDDLCDALRYTVAKIPWDFTIFAQAEVVETEEIPSELKNRRGDMVSENEAFERWANDIESEFEEWNEMAGC